MILAGLLSIKHLKNKIIKNLDNPPFIQLTTYKGKTNAVSNSIRIFLTVQVFFVLFLFLWLYLLFKLLVFKLLKIKTLLKVSPGSESDPSVVFSLIFALAWGGVLLEMRTKIFNFFNVYLFLRERHGV